MSTEQSADAFKAIANTLTVASSDEHQEEPEDDNFNPKISKRELWEPFSFSVIRRKTAAGCNWQWECQCPFHGDPFDVPTTACQRAMEFADAATKGSALVTFKAFAIV